MKKSRLLTIITEEIERFVDNESNILKNILNKYIENDEEIYKSYIVPLYRHLIHKKQENSYDRKTTEDLFKFVFESIMEKMQSLEVSEKEIVDVQEKLAKEYADEFEKDYDLVMGDAEEMEEVEDLNEKAPPGMEKVIMTLKKELPKTYIDKHGQRRPSNPFAVAWAMYNREKRGKK